MFWITIFMVMSMSFGSGGNSSSLLFIPADKLIKPEYADASLKYLLLEETIKQDYSPKNPANKVELTKTRLAIIYSQSCTIFSQGDGNFKIRLNTELYFEKVKKLFDIAYYAMEGITSSRKNLRAQFFSRGFSNPNTKSVLDTIYDTLQQSNLHEKFAGHVFNTHNISSLNWDKGLQNTAAKTIGAVKNAGNGLMKAMGGAFNRHASSNTDDPSKPPYPDGPIIMGKVVKEPDDTNPKYQPQQPVAEQAQYAQTGRQQEAAQASPAAPAQSTSFMGKAANVVSQVMPDRSAMRMMKDAAIGVATVAEVAMT